MLMLLFVKFEFQVWNAGFKIFKCTCWNHVVLLCLLNNYLALYISHFFLLNASIIWPHKIIIVSGIIFNRFSYCTLHCKNKINVKIIKGKRKSKNKCADILEPWNLLYTIHFLMEIMILTLVSPNYCLMIHL